MLAGTRVVHPELGPGVVARMMDGGRRCMVRFDGRPAVPEVLPVDALGMAAPERPHGMAAPERPHGMAAPERPHGRGGQPAADNAMAAETRTAVGAITDAPSAVGATTDAPSAVGAITDAPSAVGATTDAPTGVDPRSSRADRQSLEALRLGVVPARGLHALTVGRHPELARVEELLDRRSGMLVLSGSYGAGKTHMVELAEADALQRGFLVARATFDPVEVPPSHPLRLYAALARQLIYPDRSGTGLRPLMDALGDSKRHLTGERWHRWLSPALFAVHHGDHALAENVLDFVEGRSRDDPSELHRQLGGLGYRRPRLLALPDYRTFGQIMAHLLGGIATWASDAGYKGLLLLLDEAEYLDQLGATSRDMAENVLKYLAVGSLPVESLAFDPGEVYRGGQAIHRTIATRFCEDQPLAVLCAFTPNPQVARVLAGIFSGSSNRIDLEPVRESMLPLLAEKVFGLVKQVYPNLDPEPRHRLRVTKALASAFRSGDVSTTRQAARMVVEFWDIYRLDPSRALAALAP